MINKQSLIDGINKGCNLLFDSTFHLQQNQYNSFSISGNITSKALNSYKNERQEVNVIKWFDIFWIYLEVSFAETFEPISRTNKRRIKKTNTFISLSVFQGEQADSVKNQLFRAEWDDYNNEEEKHPQPHWHITSNQALENTFKELIEEDNEEGFAALILNEEKSKIVEINNIHFAMNGNWINNATHIQSINDVNKIVKWFQGLFPHLREQLEYVKK